MSQLHKQEITFLHLQGTPAGCYLALNFTENYSVEKKGKFNNIKLQHGYARDCICYVLFICYIFYFFYTKAELPFNAEFL